MEINLNNYEAFFLDYKEGSLSGEQEKELFLFLEQHPHLYEELHSFENVTLEDLGAEEVFVNKNGVKKPDFTNDNLIAYSEGFLDEDSRKQIEEIALQNEAFQKELTFYTSAKIQPDLSEKFKNKAKLKRGGVVISLQNNYTFLRLAAALLLLIGLFFLAAKLNTNEEAGKNKIEVAEVENRKQEQKSNNQEPVSSKQVATNSLVNEEQKSKESLSNKQLAVKSNKKQEQGNNKLPAVNPVQTNSVTVNKIVKNTQKDSLAEKIILAENNSKKEDQNINRSYYNYSADKEDSDAPVTASINTGKKSFFQKLVKVAKKVNDLGVKNVEAVEENDSNTLSIGSFVVAESTSSK